MNNKIVAIITARGGSKGLPRKNVLDLNGKPLIAYTIEAALASKIFSKVIVTTDDKEIKEVSLKYGAEVIDRPKELATDNASSLDVIEHTLLEVRERGGSYSHFILLQPTSPLRTANHITEAWNEYINKSASSLVSVTEVEHTPYKMLIEKDGIVQPLTQWNDLTQLRQKLPTAYLPNGAIYISKIDEFLKDKNLFVSPLIMYKMSRDDSVDVDTIIDFQNIEEILKK